MYIKSYSPLWKFTFPCFPYIFATYVINAHLMTRTDMANVSVCNNTLWKYMYSTRCIHVSLHACTKPVEKFS